MSKPIHIHLGAATNALPVGASHWWGVPDLPEDYDIPTIKDEQSGEEFALTLICQINLRDIAAFDTKLPKSGLMLFFGDIAYYNNEWDEPSIFMHPSDNKVVRVIYVPEEKLAELQNCGDIYDDFEYILPPQPIAFNDQKPTGEEPEHQLLGTTEHLEWESWPEPCQGWELLLQMDSCEGENFCYNFFDWGVLCFLIEHNALANNDFSNVLAIILST